MLTRFIGFVPALFTLTAAALAQSLPTTTTVTTRVGNFAVDVGNSQYGTNVAWEGRAERRITSISGLPISGSFRVDDSVVGRVRMRGVNREAAAVTSFGQVGGSLQAFGAQATYAGGFTIRIGGNTIVNPSFSGTANVVLGWNSQTAVLNFLSTSAVIPTPIGLDVTLDLTARASGSIGISATLAPQQLQATITGTARGVATGIASASVGVLCAQAGVSFTLNLMNTTLTPSITVGYQQQPSGQIGYRLEPVRFAIDLFASLCGLTATVNVVDVSAGLITGTRQLL